MAVHQFLRRLVENVFASPADVNFRAEPQIILGHFLAEPGAAARHQNALALQQPVAKHRNHLILPHACLEEG